MAETFRPHERILRRPEFQRVFEQGTRLHGRYLTLVVLANETSAARLGIVATRKIGGAVARNLAKRRIRHLFRLQKPAGLDVIVLPRRELLDAPFTSLEADYRSALRRHRRPRR